MMSKWNFEKNEKLGLFPDKLTCGSNKMAWWTCNKDERHVFSAKICHIFEGRIVCPICSNQKILVGVNDLATTNPELLNEWNYDKNEITPQQVTYGKIGKCGGNVVCAVANGRRQLPLEQVIKKLDVRIVKKNCRFQFQRRRWHIICRNTSI